MTEEERLAYIKSWDSYIKYQQLSEEDNLLYQLNHDNDTDFTLEEVEFGPPRVIKVDHVDLLSPNDPIENNTRVTVTAKAGSRFRGSDDYCYRRIDIGIQWKVLYGNKPLKLPDPGMTAEEIKQYVRRKMPFRYDSLIVSKVINNGKPYIEIVPIDNSYLYIGIIKVPLVDDKDGVIVRINRGKEQGRQMNGLDYHYHNQVLTLQGLDYHYHHDVLKLEGLDYHYHFHDVIELQGLDYHFLKENDKNNSIPPPTYSVPIPTPIPGPTWMADAKGFDYDPD